MKVISKGHDPDLGRKFASEYGGAIFGRPRRSRRKTVTQEDLGQRPPQEAQDEIVSALVRRLAEEEARPGRRRSA